MLFPVKIIKLLIALLIKLLSHMKIVTLITPFTIFIDIRPRKPLQANKIEYSKNIKKKKIFCITKCIYTLHDISILPI